MLGALPRDRDARSAWATGVAEASLVQLLRVNPFLDRGAARPRPHQIGPRSGSSASGALCETP